MGASDDEMLAAHASALAGALAVDLPAWVMEQILVRLPDATAEAASAAHAVDRELLGEIRLLLETDIDSQPTTPLTLVRRAVRYPTEVLAVAAYPPARRDEFAVRAFPDDVYALSPATFADISPRVGELGLVWGAAKAHVHLSRRRAEGRR